MEKMAVLDGLIGTYVAALPLGQEKVKGFSMRIILASTVLSSRAGVRDVSEGSGGTLDCTERSPIVIKRSAMERRAGGFRTLDLAWRLATNRLGSI
jgi:hypothetical protein